MSILRGSVPSTYDEIISVKGCGPKVTREALKEGFGIVDGIGADVHMCRIFGVLGWAEEVTSSVNGSGELVERINNTRTAEQMMTWWPKHLNYDMNRTYAGLGQLLQKADTRDALVELLLKVPERWMATVIKKILKLPQYS